MIIRIISAVLYVLLAPILGGLLEGIDRKISARMQGRKGPSIFQSIYDVIKLLHKEAITVSKAQVFLVISYLLLMIFTGVLLFAGFDVLLCFFVLSTAALFLLAASSVTGSPYSNIGAERELLQMLAYEPMVLLTAVGFYLATESFKVTEIISTDYSPIIKLPGVFLGFCFILTIKMRKSPFDLSTSHHAHQEVIKGITTEMSGKVFAAVTIAEWYENIFLMGIIAMFILNSSIASIPFAILLCALCYFVEILIDNVSARLKWNTTLALTWAVSFILGAINIIVLVFTR